MGVTDWKLVCNYINRKAVCVCFFRLKSSLTLTVALGIGASSSTLISHRRYALTVSLQDFSFSCWVEESTFWWKKSVWIKQPEGWINQRSTEFQVIISTWCSPQAVEILYLCNMFTEMFGAVMFWPRQWCTCCEIRVNIDAWRNNLADAAVFRWLFCVNSSSVETDQSWSNNSPFLLNTESV